MFRVYWLILAASFIGGRASGQLPGQEHLIRLGIASFTNPNSINLAYEYRWKHKAGVAIQGSYFGHGRLPENVFAGDWVALYAQERTDAYVPGLNKTLGTDDWQYLTEDRPLPEAPGSYVPLNSLIAKIGYVMSYASENKRWNLILQPGFFAGRHRYFVISDDIQVFDEWKKTRSWPYIGSYYAVATEQTRFYRQTRSMRRHNTAIYGLSYDLGISARLGKRFFVELRGVAGYNLHVIFESAPPAPAGRFFGQLGVSVGYAIH